MRIRTRMLALVLFVALIATVVAALVVFPRADAHTRTPAVTRWEPLVEILFGDAHKDRVLHIIWCESRGDPSVKQQNNGPALGLLQFEPRTWRWVWRWMMGDEEAWRNRPYDPLTDNPVVDPANRTNPVLSLIAARVLALHIPGGGWSHWTCDPGAHW